MPEWQGNRIITVVTAYVKNDGLPDFMINEVSVTHDEHANGLHYDLVEAILARRGIEEPWVHFGEFEAPSFLMPAVKKHLSGSTISEPYLEPACPEL